MLELLLAGLLWCACLGVYWVARVRLVPLRHARDVGYAKGYSAGLAQGVRWTTLGNGRASIWPTAFGDPRTWPYINDDPPRRDERVHVLRHDLDQ